MSIQSDRLISSPDNQQQGTRFPKAVLSVSREELDGVELTVKQGMTEEAGTLPADLQGHLFMVSPVGTLDSPQDPTDPNVVTPSSNGWTPVFNGDGMVYRFDFCSGKAELTSRIMKTPCYYADLATHTSESPYSDLKFKNLGFVRGSLDYRGLVLGFRNQLNTAFMPIKFAGEDRQRLLVTWDMGRPFELDPLTLKLIAPVGWNEQWQHLIEIPGSKPPFKQVVTSAHAAFDPHKGEMFTVNIGKSLSTMLALAEIASSHLQNASKLLKKSSHRSWFKLIDSIFNWLKTDNFVRLILWNGQGVGDITRWELVLDDGSPIKIQETLHQMGVTQDYIVLADTSFKFDFGEVLPYSMHPIIEDLETDTFDAFDFAESTCTYVYIVRRADLNRARDFYDLKKINVQKVKIPLAMAHYVVDYDNPDGKITLHTEHVCATDPSETLRMTDDSVFEDSEIPDINKSLKELGGSIAGAMDVSRLGCHVIDVENGKVDSKYALDREQTWSTAFYAYRDEMPTKKFEDIYWNSWGCWTDALSQHIYNLYKDYPDRTVPLEKDAKDGEKSLEQYFREGVPSSICRLHIDRSTDSASPQLEIQDSFVFPKNYLGTSIQFIPKANSEGSTAGYIVCAVIHSDNLDSSADADWSNNSEIWVLDAANLKGGVLYRLSHPKLNLGFTLHTTWLASIPDTPSTRSYDIRHDYESIVGKSLENSEQPKHYAHKAQEIRELFEREIYPHFELERSPE